ncbi:MAG: hypothetical protein R3C20_25450 [Planctomycetaceae bacterium]
MAEPAEDEWSGFDELYRIADASAMKLSPTSGQIRAHAKQDFELYGGFFEDSFPAGHVNPYVQITGEFEFKTNGPPQIDVGIMLSGNVLATGSVSITGSLTAADLIFYHADCSASATAHVSVAHPLQGCTGGDQEIDEAAVLSGSVNTESLTSGSVSITAGGSTKTVSKEKGEGETNNGVTVGVMNQVTLSDSAFSASAGLTDTMVISGSTDTSSVRIPVSIVVTTTGAGTASDAFSTGSATALVNVVWSGDAWPCAMPDPSALTGGP